MLNKSKNKGITLIALVVSIIVLLILAGISIAMLSGDNGLLTKAGDAKTKTDDAQIRERIQLAYHSALTGGQGSYTKESLEDELKKEFGENNYNVDDSDDTNWVLMANVQGKEQSVTIPAGEIELSADTTWQEALEFPQYNYNRYIIDAENGTITLRSGPSITNEIDLEIKKYAVIDGKKYETKLPDSCLKLFWMDKVKSIKFDKDINTSNVTDMQAMFLQCNNLTSLDLSGFDTSNVTNMTSMFAGPNKLTTIYVSNEFVTSSISSSTDMFSGCTSLVGGNGTTYNSSKTDATYARIDGGTSNPEYFTAK